MATRKTIRYTALAELEEHKHPENPKDHAIDELMDGMERFGFTVPILVCDRTGYIAAGHGRLEALQTMRLNLRQPPEDIEVNDKDWLAPVVHGWSSKDDDELLAYVIADNRHTELGGWLPDRLPNLLKRLADGPGLKGVGYTGDDLKELFANMKDGEGGGGSDPSDGSLLALADVTIGEPEHQVTLGDVFRINERHVLICSDVMSGWNAWKRFLTEDALFVPYPGPYAAISQKADLCPLVLVQPDPFLAGHILDKFASSNDEGLIAKVEG